MINLGNKINTITLAYAAKLGLKIRKTNIKAQKIDNSTLETFEIVLANFQMKNKLNRIRFFQKTFLVVKTTLEMIFGMFFFIFSDVDI